MRPFLSLLPTPAPSALCASLALMLTLLALPAAHAATKKAAHASAPASAARDAKTPEGGPVSVQGAWIRATVKGQSGTGGFMQLTSTQPLSLTGFSTPIAESAELHEMAMEGNVMRMHPIESLALPANQAVTLRPGGHHLMLMGLKQVLKDGDAVPVTLLLRGEDGKVSKQLVSVPIRLTPPAGAPAMGGMGGGTMAH